MKYELVDIEDSGLDAVYMIIEVAKTYLNMPYLWAGDDPTGFDCSGMAIECLRAVGKFPLKGDEPAWKLWERFQNQEVSHGKPGALAFWFNSDTNKAVHVAVCINNNYCVTADGGGSKTLTLEDAIKQNAFIKIRKIDHRKAEPRFAYPFGIFEEVEEEENELDKKEGS